MSILLVLFQISRSSQRCSYVILEVKADHMIDDEVVGYATQLADANRMRDEIIPATKASVYGLKLFDKN